jgi:hypothetical protein
MKYIIIIILFAVTSLKTNAQGCSDAGACSVGAMGSHSESSTFNNKIRFGLSNGLADHDIMVYGSFLEYSGRVGDFSFDLKLTSETRMGEIFGEDVANSNFSDLFLVSNYSGFKDFAFTAGIKIPLNKSDSKFNINEDLFFNNFGVKEGNVDVYDDQWEDIYLGENPTNENPTYRNVTLPMDFQTSLGTYDLILGMAYSIDDWSFMLAYQHPLTQNDVQSMYYLDQTNNNLLIEEIKDFKRAPDLIFRSSYNWSISENWTLSPSVLAIYHIYSDEFLRITYDINNDLDTVNDSTHNQSSANAYGLHHFPIKEENEVEIQDSKGLTLNLNLNTDYKINENHVIGFNLAFPVIIRNIQPDGTKRFYVVATEYKYQF